MNTVISLFVLSCILFVWGVLNVWFWVGVMMWLDRRDAPRRAKIASEMYAQFVRDLTSLDNVQTDIEKREPHES